MLALTFLCCLGSSFAHALTVEVEAVGVVDEAVQDCVGIGGVTDTKREPRLPSESICSLLLIFSLE